MALYKLQKKLTGDPFQFIIKKGPPDTIFKENAGNTDWVEYKAWVDAGNTPDPVE